MLCSLYTFCFDISYYRYFSYGDKTMSVGVH